jgi:hypothetical protein
MANEEYLTVPKPCSWTPTDALLYFRNRKGVVFLEQSIDGAYALYAILHALFNGAPHSMLGS